MKDVIPVLLYSFLYISKSRPRAIKVIKKNANIWPKIIKMKASTAINLQLALLSILLEYFLFIKYKVGN